MLRLIKFLFTGDWHLHEWEIIGKGDITGGGYSTVTVGHYYNLQCKHCGNVKCKNV